MYSCWFIGETKGLIRFRATIAADTILHTSLISFVQDSRSSIVIVMIHSLDSMVLYFDTD